MPDATAGQSFTTSDNCRIEFKVRPARGAGAPRLALIHSLALDGGIWNGVAEALAGEVELLTYDCRGHGESDRIADAYTSELFAGDLSELLDYLNWPSAAVAGCSMGGCVALAFAGMNPGRTSALGLIDTTAWYGADAPKNWRERAAAARTKGFAGMVDFQTKRWFSEKFRNAHPDLVKQTADVFLANDLECYGATCRMLGDADLRHYLRLLRMPTAVIVGEDDDATPPSMARFLHDSIPGSTLTVIPGGRHLTPIESPREIAAGLRSLLDRAKAGKAAEA